MRKQGRTKKKSNKVFKAVLVLAFLGILGLIGGLFSVTYFSVTPKHVYQYAGRFVGADDVWLKPLSPKPVASLTAKIGPYEVRSTIFSSGCEETSFVCEPNTCSGTKTGVDDDGCDLWEGKSSRPVWTNCKATVYTKNYCSCRDGDINKCYDPYYPDYSGWTKSSEPLTVRCGGAKHTSTGCADECWSEHTIFFEGETIKEVPLTRQNRVVGLDGLTANLHFRSVWVPSTYGSNPFCARVENAYYLTAPTDAFTINVSAPKQAVSRGEENSVTITVTNDYSSEAYVSLEVVLGVPTVFGEATNTTTQIIRLPVGASEHEFFVPTTRVTDKVFVRVRGDVMFAGSEFSGVNGLCYGQTSNAVVPLSSCGYVKIGEIEENEYSFAVFESLPELCAAANIASGKQCEEYVAGIISGLEGDLDAKLDYIDRLSLRLDEKLSVIAALELSIEEQAVVIDKYELTVREQAAYIEALGLSVQEQSALITVLEASIEEKAALIKQLESTRAAQTQIIQGLQVSVKEQAELITELGFTIQEQAEYIGSLKLTVQEQAEFISLLESSLEEKGALISGLTSENARQAELIKEMRVSFEAQAEIIGGLKETVEGDAEVIRGLTSNVEEQGRIVSAMKADLNKKAEIIAALSAENAEQARLIKSMELSLVDQGKIIVGLRKTVVDDAEIIQGLSGEVSEQAAIIAGMRRNSEDQQALIRELYDGLAEQEALVAALEAELLRQEAATKNAWFLVAGLVAVSILIYIVVVTKKRRSR